jgi:hypothetical protein
LPISLDRDIAVVVRENNGCKSNVINARYDRIRYVSLPAVASACD